MEIGVCVPRLLWRVPCLIVLNLIPARMLCGDAPRGVQPEPSNGMSMQERGDLYMVHKMFREAIDAYNQIQPVTAETMNRIGIAYQQQNEHAEAAKYYRHAIEVNPRYAEAVNNLGTVYYSEHKYRHATSLYKRALALQPNSAPMHINLGMAWLARHNDEQWQRQMQRALELDPEIFERRGNHGIVVEQRSPIDRAKFALYLARLYARRGDSELALQYIAKALEAGYKERKQLLEDKDFVAVRRLPEFDVLMKQPPKVL